MKEEIRRELASCGWNTEELYELIQVLDDLRELRYELDNCRRGCYTGAVTYEELASTVNRLAVRLGEAADDIPAGHLDRQDEKEIEAELAEE